MCRIRPLIALGLCLTGPAQATILGGGLTQQHGNGVFVSLDTTAPFTVGQDHFDTDHLYAFNEAQNVVLSDHLAVDIGGVDGVIPGGTAIASHYVFFDSVNGFQMGWVDFDAPILGIAAQADTLAASDFLGHPEVRYVSTELRGLERGDVVWIDDDTPHRLWVSWAGSSPGDYIRVLTARSAEALLY